LREWSRVLRSGGGIAVLVDSKFARTSWMLTHSECKPAEVFEFLENRKKNGFRVNGAQATTHVFSPNELSGMMGSCGLEVTVSAGLLALWQGLDNGELQSRLAENFDLWKKLELKYCQEPSLTGLGRQILVVARKP
nr:hypothetical protein [Candidatus Korarchaeota archaeon]